MHHTPATTEPKAGRRVLAVLFVLAVLAASAQAQAIFSNQQSAWTLKPGQIAIGGIFSSVSWHHGGNSAHAWNAYSVSLGFGLAQNIELCARYEYLDPKYDQGVSAVSFGPKISFLKNIVAVYVPLEFAFGNDNFDVSDTWNVQPTLLATFPLGRQFELTPSVKALIPFKSGSDTLLAVNMGFGVFALENKRLLIRPEFGILVNPGESGSYWQFSVGVSYRIKD